MLVAVEGKLSVDRFRICSFIAVLVFFVFALGLRWLMSGGESV